LLGGLDLEVYLGIFRQSLRATTKNDRQLFWQKSAPQTKSWLRLWLWLYCPERLVSFFQTAPIVFGQSRP